MINTALTTKSDEQLTSGQKIVNDGLNLIDSSGTRYNRYADTVNAQLKSNPSFGLGILLGTGILWLTNLAIIIPTAKYIAKRKLTYQLADGYQTQLGQEASQISDKSFTTIYIITGVVVFAIIGFVT